MRLTILAMFVLSCACYGAEDNQINVTVTAGKVDKKKFWEMKEDYMCKGILIKSQAKLTDLSKRRIEALLGIVEGWLNDFAKEHEFTVRGKMPEKIVFLEEVVYKRITVTGIDNIWGLCMGNTIWVGNSKNGEFDSNLFLHEICHAVIGNDVRHHGDRGRDHNAWACEAFVFDYKAKWAKLKKSIR